MNRSELITKTAALKAEVTTMNREKTASLEAALANESTCYAWRREQMIAIHQMKYHFSKEILKLHQEFRRLNQETRCQVERLRRGEPLLPPKDETPVVDNVQPASDAP